MLIRRTGIELFYQGVNISEDVSKDLLGFTYTDNASGAADDIAVSLKDDTGKWISDWAPQKGDIIQAKVDTLNWRYNGDSQQLDCGVFMVDELDYSGRPRVMEIGAVSCPADTDFANAQKSRTWENINVKTLSNGIASNYGMELFFDSSQNPLISFMEQSETSDRDFLFDVCKKYGLAMKIYNSKIVIFNEEEYEKHDAVYTIYEKDMLSWGAKTTLTNTGYSGCAISFTDIVTNDTFHYEYRIKGGGKLYKINEQVSSYAEAEIVAKNRLRELNKSENSISIKVPGNIALVAGSCIYISDLGIFDGKYFVDKAVHSISNGYTTDLEMHKVLEGY